MELKVLGVIYGLYLLYELLRIIYECWAKNLTLKEWWNTPLKNGKSSTFDA